MTHEKHHSVESTSLEEISISVVVPTLLRESVSGAIQSIRAQTSNITCEIIVVVDRAKSKTTQVELEMASGADLVLFTGGRRGAPAARNLGVSAASGSWVAFLDDDDVWDKRKIENQMNVAQLQMASSDLMVVSGRVCQRAANGVRSRPLPDRIYDQDKRVEDYLFRGRKASIGRQSMFTSTLVVTRKLAELVPWDETLKRHQDWDWLVRAQHAGARIVQLQETVSTQNVGSANSISASSDWSASLQWCTRWNHVWNRQTYADFIVAQPLRYALQARSYEGILQCFKELSSVFRIPNIHPMLIGLAGILPRKSMEALMLPTANKRNTTDE